jgi:hypothetical protein
MHPVLLTQQHSSDNVKHVALIWRTPAMVAEVSTVWRLALLAAQLLNEGSTPVCRVMLRCPQVELVQETPGWLQLSVDGLQKPLELTYWQREDVIRVKVGFGSCCCWCCWCCFRLLCYGGSCTTLQMSSVSPKQHIAVVLAQCCSCCCWLCAIAQPHDPADAILCC